MYSRFNSNNEKTEKDKTAYKREISINNDWENARNSTN
ncbi:hypothetical protein FEM08_13930 [Flavobacterium gilvum]|nr:hypothetical protein FEM08_13930 [Flavobacterium gilvum]